MVRTGIAPAPLAGAPEVLKAGGTAALLALAATAASTVRLTAGIAAPLIPMLLALALIAR